MSSRRPTLKRPTSIGATKPPPILDYAARPRIGSEHPGAAAGYNRNTNMNNNVNNSNHATSNMNMASSAAAAAGYRGIGNTEDFRSGPSFTARTNWNVEDGALRPLPPLHPPLDPASSAFVCDASPSVIAARVSDCLRERSIMTEFDDDAATANAMTANRVRFTIRLYRGGAPSSPFSHGVIIDIQRLRGDPMTFHQSSRAILSAAQGDSYVANIYNQMVPNHGMGLALDIPFPGVMPNHHSPSKSIDDQTSMSMALEIVWKLIKKDRMDAHILGWESLALLTDENGSGRATALIAARVVLGMAPSGNAEDEGEDERYAEIHASVISLIRDHNSVGNNDNDMNANNEAKNDADYYTAEDQDAWIDIEHVTVQRSLAIRSIANSLEAVANANDPRFMEHALHNLVINEDIVPSLLREVEQSVHLNNPFNASDATHSARALSVLFELSEDARNIAHARNALSVLSKARIVGRSRHAALEQEAGRAFGALNNTQRES